MFFEGRTKAFVNIIIYMRTFLAVSLFFPTPAPDLISAGHYSSLVEFNRARRHWTPIFPPIIPFSTISLRAVEISLVR